MNKPTIQYTDSVHEQFTRVPAPSTHDTQDKAQAVRANLLLGAIVFAGGAIMAAMILVRMIQ